MRICSGHFRVNLFNINPDQKIKREPKHKNTDTKRKNNIETMRLVVLTLDSSVKKNYRSTGYQYLTGT